ncbi:hypothetical protein [Micromonospora noduli]|nr:hypothetical protein [Micromonospora noduli]
MPALIPPHGERSMPSTFRGWLARAWAARFPGRAGTRQRAG